ncbi:MAG: DUF3341 domain-containing protein [Gemmatimonadetes bacterium]|nr:DUF3341 domain-containing protein [Gemmatimonadota bacterium]
MKKAPGGILAVFEHVDAAAESIKALKGVGYDDFTVYSPVPNHELEEAVGHPVSPVRLWTLVGGLTGMVFGFALTLWTSYDYPVVVGGKGIGSIPPYIIIAFEMTILFGALSTVAGLVFHAVMDSRPAAYDPRFTDDHIGVFVPCPVERRPNVEGILKEHGAKEVRVEL